MLKHKASKRYAKALFELSRHSGKLEVIYQEILEIQKLIQESSGLAAFLQNIELNADVCEKILTRIFKNTTDEMIFNFILFLNAKHRLNLLQEICPMFAEIVSSSSNILNVEIVSAQPLPPNMLQLITNRLKEKFNREIHAHNETDPRIIGGFKLQYENTISDFSISNALDKFKNSIIFS